MKKVFSIIVCTVLCMCTVLQPAFAKTRDTSFEEQLAQDLKALGLFEGVSETEFDLGRAPTRTEALVMLIRLLGKEEDAQNSSFRHPFTDVPAWADKYVGYAYQNGLTNGTSATTFGVDTANAQMYLTFVLRALGYSDTNGEDFLWNNPYVLAESLGALPSCVNRTTFLRADVVTVSYASLSAKLKGSTQTLAQKLIADKVFTYEQYMKHYDSDAIANYSSGPKELTAEQVYNKCSPAVFYIEVYDAGGYATGSGSGFFLDGNGTAVTNYHVLEDSYSANITLSGDGNVYKVEGVYDYSIEQDWAVIKVEGSGFPYMEIGDDATVVGGATVYAIGSPLGLQSTISQGLISNANRQIDGATYIQTSAAISHGSSGGALINKYGQAIGVTSAGFTDGENLGLAIPVKTFEDYDSSNLITVADMTYRENAPISVKPSGGQPILPNANNAYACLSAFVDVYQNDSYDGDIAYTEEMNTQNGVIRTGIVKNAEDGGLSVIVFESYEDTYYFMSLELTGVGRNRFLFYSYEASKNYNLEAYKYLDASTVTAQGRVRLENISGRADVAINEQICSEYIALGLYFVNILFDNYLSDYGNFSVYDFGYVNFR